MIKIAICDDSKVDVEQLETVLDTLCHYEPVGSGVDSIARDIVF